MSGARLTLLGTAALAASFVITLALFPWSDERITDLLVYAAYAREMLDGSLPYRDFAFEYPPLAAPVLALAGVAGTDWEPYRLAFAAVMFALAAGVLVAVRDLARRTGGDEALAVAAVAVSPLVLGATLRNHFDLLPVALTVAALVLLLRGRAVAGFALLGAAVMAKGFPLVVAPVAIAWVVARGERRVAARATAALAAVMAAVGAVALLASPSGALDAVRYHADRPPQLESVPALGIRVLDWLGAGEAAVVQSFGSHNLIHPAGDALALTATLLGVLAIALLAVLVARGPGPRELVLGSLAAVAAFAAFGKVLSPQFLVWLVPLGALALAWGRYALAAAVAAATLLTFVEFPARYADLLAYDPFTVTVVAVRDVLLVAVVALCLRELAQAGGPSGAGLSASRARAITS